MKITEQQPICTRPFEWFEVHPDGSVFLCCPAWLKRPIGNLLQQGVEEIWNGSLACEIRKSILNGSFHNCSRSRCPHLADVSGPVGRIATIEDAELKASISNNAVRLCHRPRQLNLCFDHSCNLACPSCRQEIQQAHGDELERVEQIAAIVETELLPHAQAVTLSGFGDPFGSPTYFRLLRRLNWQTYPQLQQVRLHSNGQLLTEKMWQSLPTLQPLVSEIEISIDAATEQTYRLNRPGGDFAKLLNNLEHLSRIGIRLTLSMVVQENNWHEIPELIALSQRLGAHLYLSQLVNWGTFSREEFLRRAVHLPGHPAHPQLRQLLRTIPTETQQIRSNLPFMH